MVVDNIVSAAFGGAYIKGGHSIWLEGSVVFASWGLSQNPVHPLFYPRKMWYTLVAEIVKK